MELTLAQWLELHKRHMAAVDAVVALREYVTHMTLVHSSRNHPAAVEYLKKAEDDVAAADTSLLKLDFRPLDEWTGGDSSAEGNSKWREPLSVAGGLSARRYFTKREVDEARKKGLLP